MPFEQIFPQDHDYLVENLSIFNQILFSLMSIIENLPFHDVVVFFLLNHSTFACQFENLGYTVEAFAKLYREVGFLHCRCQLIFTTWTLRACLVLFLNLYFF